MDVYTVFTINCQLGCLIASFITYLNVKLAIIFKKHKYFRIMQENIENSMIIKTEFASYC